QERGIAGKVEDATLAHRTACELGAASSCVRLIVGPGIRGKPVKLGPDDLAESLGFACERDDADACLALGLAYESGWVVPRDAARAKERFEIACERGSKTACARAGKKPL